MTPPSQQPAVQNERGEFCNLPERSEGRRGRPRMTRKNEQREFFNPPSEASAGADTGRTASPPDRW